MSQASPTDQDDRAALEHGVAGILRLYRLILLDTVPNSRKAGAPRWAVSVLFTWIAIFTLTLLFSTMLLAVWPAYAINSLRRRPDKSIRTLTGLAGVLAGHRHAHLRDAWAADLYGDPESGEALPGSRQLRMAASFVVAALRCRLDDAIMLAWRPADALAASWHGSRLAVCLPVTVAAGLVLLHEGFYGLVVNAENLGVIATAPYLAIKGLRHYRQIDTPKRPEKKQPEEKASAAGGPGQRPE